MRITLSGDLGSGKSSVGRRLSERLGIPYISTGTLFREIGQISNMDALATNLAAETNTEIDAAVDERTRELNKTLPHFIIDSRMAWHFVTDAVRVFLSVCPETAAYRIVSDQTRKGERYGSKASALEMLARRRKSELKRYKTLYNVDIEDQSNYDLWIITDDAEIDDICEVILSFSQKKVSQRRWIPKRRIVPMVDIRDASEVVFSTLSIDDQLVLPVLISRNFGFFFQEAHALISALNYERSLVPYRTDAPTHIDSSRDPFDVAIRKVTATDLYDWEKACRVQFSFHRCIDEASDTPG